MSSDDEFRKEVMRRLRRSFPGEVDLPDDELLEVCKDTLTLAAIRLNVRWGQVKDEFWKAWSEK